MLSLDKSKEVNRWWLSSGCHWKGTRTKLCLPLYSLEYVSFDFMQERFYKRGPGDFESIITTGDSETMEGLKTKEAK